MNGRRWRRVVLGEAGPVPALILAGVTLVISFIVIAGPRALAAAGDRAVAQALAHAPAIDAGTLITADQQEAQAGAGRPTGVTAATVARLTKSFGQRVGAETGTGRDGGWGGLVVPARGIIAASPPPLGRPQTIEVGYRTGLASHAALLAGRLPAGSAQISRGPGGQVRAVIISIAVSRVTASTFRLHPGSVVRLGSAGPGTPLTRLRVTGIVRPLAPSSAYWQYDPVLAAPTLLGPSTHPYWLGGAFTGAGQLAGLDAAYAGTQERAAWFFPLAPARLTRAAVPRIESAAAALAASPAVGAAESAAGAPGLRDTAVSTGLADGLATFEGQWASTAGADSVLVTGLFAVGLALLLTCCGLASRAYRPELELMRVRGGSLPQVAARMVRRSACITVPAFAAGAAIAITAVPGGGGAGARLGLAFGLAALFAAPVICVLQHRRAGTGTGPGRPGQAARRGGVRRVVGELAVLGIAVATLADVRLAGVSGVTGTTAPYLSASAVLIAIAVGLVLNRCYRRPLRLLARASASRPGAVGAVSLASAADRPPAAVLPVLAIMLSLTLTAFSAMVLASITSGQRAGSWERVGADAVITAPGTATFTMASVTAISRVPGVRHATAVFTWPDSGASGAVLQAGGQSKPVGLAVVDPRRYAALAAGTPWPDFPARALGRRPGPVPVLVSAGLAGPSGHPGAVVRLNVFGQEVAVRVAGVTARTAAMPGGGQFVLGPLWASARLGVPGPATLLVTGPVRPGALRAAAARILPGSQITVRSQVLAGLDASPALRTSRGLYRAGALAAAVLTGLAVLFWLMASARDRGRLATRLGALGMAGRQAVLLGISDAAPLLALTAAGAAASVWLLAGVIGPVLGLNSFTGSRFPVPLIPTWADLGLPVAGAVLLALAVLVADGARARLRNLAADLRHEEAR
ncbi:MAG TPA: hypothetical protein VF843_09115 [Streptosporangiaceae bacterium]